MLNKLLLLAFTGAYDTLSSLRRTKQEAEARSILCFLGCRGAVLSKEHLVGLQVRQEKNAKMCIFAQKRQPLLNAGKDRCLTFKFALLSHLRVVCVVSLIFNFELSLHLNLL